MVFLTFLYRIVPLQLTFKSSSGYEPSTSDDEPSGEELSGDESPSKDDCDEQTSPRSSFQASPFTMSDKVKT